MVEWEEWEKKENAEEKEEDDGQVEEEKEVEEGGGGGSGAAAAAAAGGRRRRRQKRKLCADGNRAEMGLKRRAEKLISELSGGDERRLSHLSAAEPVSEIQIVVSLQVGSTSSRSDSRNVPECRRLSHDDTILAVGQVAALCEAKSFSLPRGRRSAAASGR